MKHSFLLSTVRIPLVFALVNLVESNWISCGGDHDPKWGVLAPTMLKQISARTEVSKILI